MTAPQLPDLSGGLLTVIGWPDDELARLGHDPRSPYAESFWLPALGPATSCLHRRLTAQLFQAPHGYEQDLDELARALGLGRGLARTAPLPRALLRLVRFHQAEVVRPAADVPALAVRLHLPNLSYRMASRLPPRLRAQHDATIARLTNLRRVG